jgi:peroxiredoxin
MFDPEKPPELMVSRWINSKAPITLEGLRDRVVVLVAFQMLCPGCVEHGLPQAKRLAERFNPSQVAVIGLHTVFEHHHVQTSEALEVFASEYRWPFPIGVDEADGKGMPKTMAAYEMRGTPTMLVFDRAGRLRRHYFGRPDDIMVAAEIMAMAVEDKGAPREQAAQIERKIASILVSPQHDHHHHDHAHDHAHDHDGCCGHGHDHGQHHGHEHAHDHDCDGACGHQHDHDAGSERTQPASAAKPGRPA